MPKKRPRPVLVISCEGYTVSAKKVMRQCARRFLRLLSWLVISSKLDAKTRQCLKVT